MKILLTGINARYSHTNPALYYLKAFSDNTGCETTIKEFHINQKITEIIEKISYETWDAVCFSVYIWNSLIVKEIISFLKNKNPEIRIIIGGPEASNRSLDFKDADFIISGAGEAGFKFLLQEKLSHNNRIISIPNPPFDEIIFPYNEYKNSVLNRKYFYYESSRGCPHRCIYCLSSSQSIKTEFRNLNLVRKELDFIVKELKPSTVKFVDRTFNCGNGRHRDIWTFIISEFSSSGIIFHFEIHPDNLTEEDFIILEKTPAGLFQFEAGIQSVNEKTLSAIKRKSSWETAKRNIKKIISFGNIRLHADLIAGLPQENIDDIRHSFNEVYSLQADYVQLGFLKILDSTEMQQRSGEFGIEYNPAPPYNAYKTKWLSQNDFGFLDKISDLVNILYNNSRFKTTLGFLSEFFNTPFDMYEAVAESISGFQHTKKWEYGAEIILNYIKLNRPDRITFFTDSLRWDWCINSSLNNYPALLKSDLTKQNRKKIFKYFNSLKNDDPVFSEFKMERDDLKSAAFFSPETGDFREKILEDKNTALFLKSGAIIKLRLNY